MFQKDYLMRMIEQFTNFVAKIMGLKVSGAIEEVHQELNGALLQYTGLSEEALRRLSSKDILHLLGGSDEFTFKKRLMFAELLKLKADAYFDSGSKEQSYDLYLKSFHIYVETVLSTKESHLRPDFDLINEMINRLEHFFIPYETKALLFRYYERVGEYGKAEDELFELLDKNMHRSQALSEGKNFYLRLIEKSPEELVKGNLPLNEVQEGLTKIRALHLEQ
ncbi:MAG: DUF6483 family protein [Desulfitobacterium sp.]